LIDYMHMSRLKYRTVTLSCR